MANRDRRALRGAGDEILDVLAEVLTSEQWAELLRAPLEHAAAKGNRGLAQKLVGAGAEIGEALHEAVRGGHGDVVSDLLESGASVAAKDSCDYVRTPLHVAAQEGKTDMVQLLLLKGADKDAMDNKGWTPLCLAALSRNVSAALALLAAGADLSLRCGELKEPVLHVVAGKGYTDMLNAVIEHGADVNAVDAIEWSPLHCAARFNNVEAIDALAEAGANIEARDRHGGTPLHYAAAGDPSLEALLVLLKHGADVNAHSVYSQTPLHWAAQESGTQGVAKVVDSLLRSGADETILDDEGNAATDLVGEDGHQADPLAEDVDRVRELLANAPADRTWRRRGYLVLCHAHPDRVQQMHKSSNSSAGVARRTRSSVKLAKAETGSCTGTAGGSTVDGETGGTWAIAVARVLGVQEEGIFRSIVGYL